MKKKGISKFRLSRETLHILNDSEPRRVLGGDAIAFTVGSCNSYQPCLCIIDTWPNSE